MHFSVSVFMWPSLLCVCVFSASYEDLSLDLGTIQEIQNDSISRLI